MTKISELTPANTLDGTEIVPAVKAGGTVSIKTGSLLSRPRIAFGIFGQSNERGNVGIADQAAYPQAFGSLRRPGLRVPIGPAVTIAGGWWHRVYDDLYDWGYDLQVVNGAIGSLSFITQACGLVDSGQRNKVYFQKRLPNTLNAGDQGYRGDVINVSNRMFRCTTGRLVQVLNYGPNRDIANSYTALDFVQYQGTATTAATAPDFTTAVNIGDTVTDGTVVWTLESLTAYATGAPPTIGQGDFSSHEGRIFDPFGLCYRLHSEMQRVTADRKIIYIANGQSDANAGATTWYRDALVGIAKYFLRLGYEVMIGLTCYSSASASTTQYDGLVSQRTTALATLQNDATYGSKVFAGANLYASMGTTGPMASGGAFFQVDNVHLNGRGAVGPNGPYALDGGIYPASKYVSDSIKNVLPQLTRQ